MRSAVNQASSGYARAVLDHLLLVLMVVELLHTVRISVRSQLLIVEPFLIVGIMASIRRVLVITIQVAKIAEQGQPQAGEVTMAVFRNTMLEMGLLGLLTAIFVFSIYLLRRSARYEAIVAQ